MTGKDLTRKTLKSETLLKAQSTFFMKALFDPRRLARRMKIRAPSRPVA
jgi:hypothetical protein